MGPDEIIKRLGMIPHPEGGYYVETFRDHNTNEGGRARSTCIYFMLLKGQISRWHRVDAVEIWHFYGGDPLQLGIADPQSKQQSITNPVLGNRLDLGHAPQIIIPAHHWQNATSLGEWSWVGCTVAPGFEFSGFQMAEPDWVPGED